MGRSNLEKSNRGLNTSREVVSRRGKDYLREQELRREERLMEKYESGMRGLFES